MKRPTQQISKLKVNAHLGVLETAKLHQYIVELEKAVKDKPVKRGKWVDSRKNRIIYANNMMTRADTPEVITKI